MIRAVAITANNRPDYLAEALASWRLVRGQEKIPFLFACEPDCPEVPKMCQAFAEGREAPTLTVVNEHRRGALGNPHFAYDLAFAQEWLPRKAVRDDDFVVLGEDDSPVASDVLEYMSWCSEELSPLSFPALDVIAVCALRRWRASGGPDAVRLERAFCPTVWGTWRGIWKNLLSPDWDHDYSHKGWDWRISEHWIAERGWRCAIPCESRSQVSGEFGGTHLQPGEEYRAHLSDCFAPDYPPQNFRLLEG